MSDGFYYQLYREERRMRTECQKNQQRLHDAAYRQGEKIKELEASLKYAERRQEEAITKLAGRNELSDSQINRLRIAEADAAFYKKLYNKELDKYTYRYTLTSREILPYTSGYFYKTFDEAMDAARKVVAVNRGYGHVKGSAEVRVSKKHVNREPEAAGHAFIG